MRQIETAHEEHLRDEMRLLIDALLETLVPITANKHTDPLAAQLEANFKQIRTQIDEIKPDRLNDAVDTVTAFVALTLLKMADVISDVALRTQVEKFCERYDLDIGALTQDKGIPKRALH